MINILFVDDEPHILDGLRRMLRQMRGEWQMFFASGGSEAMVVLEQQPFDVIVSDMRMPGIDGAQLLAHVRDRFPNVVRIILSGYSEKEMTLKAVGAAHQYLAKPCDAEILKLTVKKACNLRSLLNDAQLLKLVSQMSSIPSLPSLYREFLAEMHAPEPSIKKIGQIVGKDIGMTAKILQMVNSAFFGLQRQVCDASEATMFLGIETIGSLVLAQQAFSQLEGDPPTGISFDCLWSHSSIVGLLARNIAEKEKPQIASDAFTAGLLHDIGKVILAATMPREYSEVRRVAQQDKLPLYAAEQHVLGTTHARVGAYLLGLWGLPTDVVEAVAFHHDPLAATAPGFSPLTAVYAGDQIFHSQTQLTLAAGRSLVPDLYLENLDLQKKVRQWQTEYQSNGVGLG